MEVRRHAIEDAFVISIEDGVIETIKTVRDLVALVKRTDCLRQATSGSGVSIIYINTNEEGETLASLVSVWEWDSHIKIRSDCVAITHRPRERNVCSATLGFG